MAGAKHILVIIDPTVEEQPALARATWLGKHLGATLELFICTYDQYLAGTRFFDSVALEQYQNTVIEDHITTLKTLAVEPEQNGLKVVVDARWDHPLDEGIVRKILETNPTLVIKDTHYHSAIKRSIFSSTDWNLMSSCPVPLLLVKPRDLPEVPTVIAAVDPVHRHDKPAALDHAIIEAAEELANSVSGDLQIFHAFDPAPSVAAAAHRVPPFGIDVKEIVETVRQQHQEAMQELVGSYSIPADHILFHQGPPHHGLIAVAIQQNADFVVMGSASRSALGRAFLGNTAEHVLDHLPCDLLLIKPPDSMRPQPV
jgi:universal stress protein E